MFSSVEQRKKTVVVGFVYMDCMVARAGAELNGLIPLQNVGWKQCIRWAARLPKPVHNGRSGLRIVTRLSTMVRLCQAFA
jgi:hypothetical protein